MGIWNWLGGLFSDDSDSVTSSDSGCSVNPATGLPMVGGCGGLDVEGNPHGVDMHSGDSSAAPTFVSATSVFDDQGADSINPATGLPMVGALDIEGNPFGTDLHSDDTWSSSTSSMDDTFTNSSSSFGDD